MFGQMVLNFVTIVYILLGICACAYIYLIFRFIYIINKNFQTFIHRIFWPFIGNRIIAKRFDKPTPVVYHALGHEFERAGDGYVKVVRFRDGRFVTIICYGESDVEVCVSPGVPVKVWKDYVSIV